MAAAGGAGESAGAEKAKTCFSPGCDKPASMRCPTCKDLGIASWFCDKDCFKSNWTVHSAFHKQVAKMVAEAAAADEAAGARRVRVPKSFEGYVFTGKLRPGVVSPQMTMPAHIVKPDYAVSGVPRSEDALRGSNVITVHTKEEQEHARKAGRLGREVLDAAAAALKPGVTGDDIDKIVHAACVERGVYPSPLNYRGFPKSVCVSVNEVICHGIPDSRPFADGDLVNLDVTVYTPEGFHSDLNETYIVGGKTDAKGRKLVQCAYECLRAAVAVCKPGVMYRDLGTVITRTAHHHGFSVVTGFTGHGIGRLFHCAPNVPHYAKNKAVGFMKAGHIFTIEPMINEGGPGDELWPDNWTAVTRDGKRSAQFEHTLLVTETGVEVLTSRIGVPDRTAMPEWNEADVTRPLSSLAEGAAGTAASASASAASEAASAAAASGGAGASAASASASATSGGASGGAGAAAGAEAAGGAGAASSTEDKGRADAEAAAPAAAAAAAEAGSA